MCTITQKNRPRLVKNRLRNRNQNRTHLNQFFRLFLGLVGGGRTPRLQRNQTAAAVARLAKSLIRLVLEEHLMIARTVY